MFYCYKEPRLKISRKERSNRRLSVLGSIGRIPELFDKKFEQRTVEFSSFYGAGSDRILGNDKGVGVPALTNLKIKTTKKRNTRRVTLSERATLHIRSARLTLDFLPVATYGLSRNPKDKTGNNSH